MPFLKQVGKYGNSCGAFCICYLNWLEAGRTPDGGILPEDEDQVMDTYRFVQFGDGRVSGLSYDYCDPTRMLALLQVSKDASFYLARTSALNLVLDQMKAKTARQKAYVEALEKEEKLVGRAPDFPRDGQAAIAVYVIKDNAGNPRGQHYILFRENQGSVSRYNPWDGVGVSATGYDEFEYGEGLDKVTLAPLGAALLVK